MKSRIVARGTWLFVLASAGVAATTVLAPYDASYLFDQPTSAAHERSPEGIARDKARYGYPAARAAAAVAVRATSPERERASALPEALVAQLADAPHAIETQPGGLSHTASSDGHQENSDYHWPSTTVHFAGTDKHTPDSETHKHNTDRHEEDTDTHFKNTDTHDSDSTFHNTESDTHYDNTDSHTNETDNHTDGSHTHFASTNTHDEPSNSHHLNTDEHDDESNEHFQNTDTHTATSTHHLGGSDIHPPSSSYHTSATVWSPGDPAGGGPGGTGGEEDECDSGGEPNRGQSKVRPPFTDPTMGSSAITLGTFNDTECRAVVMVDHKIVTVDTPRARDLHGVLRLELASGDPAAVYIERSTNGGVGPEVPYLLGSNIPVVEPGHDGCGVHDWHSGTEVFFIHPLKAGTTVLRAVVDPDPEPEGDGGPFSSATITVIGPPQSDHEIVYKSFIPCQVVSYPLGYAGGDNRTFTFTYGASSRTRQSVKVRLRPDLEGVVPGSPKEGFGVSKEYAGSSVTSSGGACPYVLVPGATPSATGTATEPPSLLNVLDEPLDGEPWEFMRSLTFQIEAEYPLAPFACSIDSEFTIEFKECGGHFWYRRDGEHDSFPAHEIYLDGAPIYTFHPGSNSILQLCNPASENPADANWIKVY